ncbi:hypothetical protein M758_4G189300 [Ceratodon purpureus]|uniref:Phytocyanin domain-containing protein n=1 Tax=Ceratodon purpureus TaxID=3225 RepID=A0A8T0ICI7_CERPU|nr:hypothetical protein KC19_4G186200 [Ceratodon purpureus]KAG0620100.1 hypothetical protein M758_4G189300 [Ceratodon purpureus]
MAPVIQGRGSARVGFTLYAVVLVGVMSTFLDVTHAVQWIVGGDAKWSYLHSNAAPTFYNDWASNKTFQTGDTLLFEYDNSTHTVLQLATGVDFTSCNLKASITKWTSGFDSVFISKAGTYYYVCGAPSHCEQGMKFSITATGNFVAAPPGAANGTSPSVTTTGHASPRAHHSGILTAILAVSVAATFAGYV